MELGFQVKAGPLSQIGMQIMTLDTAVQLAIGAYGWWKAKERTSTLLQLCAIHKGQLVTSAAFQRDVYIERRRSHMVIGSVAQEGRLHRVSMPKASTAVSDHPGETCLRALITALLCFYTIDATHQILKEVIPACLVQPDHDQDTSAQESAFVIEGSLEYSLRSTIEAIAIEEDSNTLRVKLLEVSKEAENNCFQSAGATRIRQNISYAESDAGLAVGMVKWAATSYLKRRYSTYVTRSLNILALAAVLKYVGFQVNASSRLIRSDDEAESFYTDALMDENPWGQVVLNIADHGMTDMYRSRSPMIRRGIESAAKARIGPISSIPAVAYSHARQSRYASTAELTDCFLFAFRETRNMKSSITLTVRRPQLNLQIPERPPNHFHQQLFRHWSPHFAKIVLSFVDQYVPSRPDGDAWNIDKIHEAFDLCLEPGRNDGDYFATFASYDSPALASFSILHSLILGAVYGMIMHFVKKGTQQVPELTLVAFSPAVAIPANLKLIVHNLGQVLVANNTINHLCSLMSILLLGRTTSLEGHGSMLANFFDDRRLILGMQGNGINLVSQYALHPELNGSRLCHFHIAEGQILNLPLTEEDLIVLHPHDWPTEPIAAGKSLKTDFQIFEDKSAWGRGSYRLDLEPLWEKDPREAVFRLRHNGVEQFAINPCLLQERLFDLSFHECICSQVPEKQGDDHALQRLALETVFEDAVQTTPTMRNWVREIGSRDAVLLDGTTSPALQVALLGKVRSDNTIIHIDCKRCTDLAIRSAYLGTQSILVLLASPPALPPRGNR